MKIAIEEAQYGLKKNHGGPFGAVIVKDGKIIAKAHNSVPLSKDPTAHAEINAIRLACKKLKRFNLSDCTIYSTCEPCPMCLGAIIWAKIKKVYYGCTREDAAKIGFDDKLIYDFIESKTKIKNFKRIKIDSKECLPLFEEWSLKKNKKRY